MSNSFVRLTQATLGRHRSERDALPRKALGFAAIMLDAGLGAAGSQP